jgi:Holliday junction resolvase
VEEVSGYRDGADLERAVKHYLEDNGYSLVIKSGGSKGKVDVIGLKRGETVLVQCKRHIITKEGWRLGRGAAAMSPADRMELRRLALVLGAVPLLAVWVKEGNAAREIGFTELTSMGPAGNRPWTPDHALSSALAPASAG